MKKTAYFLLPFVFTTCSYAFDLNGFNATDLKDIPDSNLAVPSAKVTPSRLLGSVRVAMNDQPGTGELLAGWLEENKAIVEFGDTGKEASAYAWLGSGKKLPAVYISPAASEPVSYRYLGALIARETGELMLRDFPESAEKRYIVASRISETFFELGGTRATMSNIDGHADAKIEASIRLWVENDPTGGVDVLKQRGVKTLGDLKDELTAEYGRLLRLVQAIDQMLVVPDDPNAPFLQAEQDQARVDAGIVLGKIDAINMAQTEFAKFSKEESAWFWNHQGSLQ